MDSTLNVIEIESVKITDDGMVQIAVKVEDEFDEPFRLLRMSKELADTFARQLVDTVCPEAVHDAFVEMIFGDLDSDNGE